MKPTSKLLDNLQKNIAEAKARSGLSQAEIGRISRVHPSQVARICSGRFRTLSHNVVQICKALGVSVPRLEPDVDGLPPEWAAAQSSMRRIWDETPEGARTIAKLLNAVADLQAAREGEASGTE